MKLRAKKHLRNLIQHFVSYEHFNDCSNTVSQCLVQSEKSKHVFPLHYLDTLYKILFFQRDGITNDSEENITAKSCVLQCFNFGDLQQ
jgi:hypothetical protein